MRNEKVIVPTKEQVKKLLEFIVNDKANHLDTVGSLLGLKLIDSLLPDDENEPNWSYEGLVEFFEAHSINGKDALVVALKKLEG